MDKADRALRLFVIINLVGWAVTLITIVFFWGAGCRATGICI